MQVQHLSVGLGVASKARKAATMFWCGFSAVSNDLYCPVLARLTYSWEIMELLSLAEDTF